MLKPMPQISIKIKIAGREYPLTVQQEEENTVREAAEMINQQVLEYEKNYSVTTKQDLLAMSALHLATQGIKARKTASTSPLDQHLIDQLIETERYIADYLNKS